MMKVRKLLSGALALGLAMSMGMTAFAASGSTTYTDAEEVVITKIYKAAGVTDGIKSPAASFTVSAGDGEVIDGEATSAPALGTITAASFAEGAATSTGSTGNIEIVLPNYDKVGVYQYTLKETPGNLAGVTYDNTVYYLKVTVINQDGQKVRVAALHKGSTSGNKEASLENTYTAGALKITKTVDGNLGDKTKYFEFTVKLTGMEASTYADSYDVTGGSYTGNPRTIAIGTETTFKLKDGDTIKIANLPAGVRYEVTETEAEDYTTTKTADTGTIEGSVATAAFTNTKNGEVDTGIRLDSLPYLMMLAIAGAGLVVLVARKRGMRED